MLENMLYYILYIALFILALISSHMQFKYAIPVCLAVAKISYAAIITILIYIYIQIKNGRIETKGLPKFMGINSGRSFINVGREYSRYAANKQTQGCVYRSYLCW